MQQDLNIGRALGKIPSGVGVLTSRNGDRESAMLASWFQQVAFDPPMIMVVVNKNRPILELITVSKLFTLNLFHTNQKDLFIHFAKGFDLNQDPFGGIPVIRKTTGCAVLADGMSFLDCTVAGEIDAGDHKVILGKILEGNILNEGHSMVHTRKNGFHY